MARFVKDGAFGYKAVPGGQSDPECTHVILTLKESCKQKSSPKMKNFEEGEKGNNKPSLQKRIFCRLNEP